MWNTPNRAHCYRVALTVTVALLAAACGNGRAAREAGAVETAPSVALTTAIATDGDIASTFEAGGIVRARTSATIAARVMAPVLSVTVRPGDRVRRGATLVTLDARELTAHVVRGKASLQAAEEAARAATSQTAAADAGLTLARATFARMSGLHAKQSATAQELDQATAALRAAEAQVAAAHAQALAASAARDAARAGADAADIGLSYTVLTAPFDGVVASRAADPGALASPGVPLLVLEESGALRLDVTVDEARAGGLAVGQSVDVRLAADADAWRSGTIAEIGRIDAAAHSFVVKVDVPAGTTARTGSFGRARFAAAPRRALTVPASSLVRRGQLAFVYVIDDTARARLRAVTAGPTVGERAEILAGLSAGEVVVDAPPAALPDGAAVTTAAAPRAADAAGGR